MNVFAVYTSIDFKSLKKFNYTPKIFLSKDSDNFESQLANQEVPRSLSFFSSSTFPSQQPRRTQEYIETSYGIELLGSVTDNSISFNLNSSDLDSLSNNRNTIVALIKIYEDAYIDCIKNIAEGEYS